VADITPDTTGCSPLTVHFVNRSAYGESYLWDFGDKIYSTEENPSHTFYVPGNYIVRLTVINLAGQSIHSGIITVFQNPSAIFDAYPTDVVNNEQVVIFYRYSHFAENYLWSFGDGQFSIEGNPFHKYVKPGTYEVSLTVISKDGCIDSAVLETLVVVEWETGTIKFPNAFKWNECFQAF
jgi:PKD repeat protein